MTQRLVNPAASAARAISASVCAVAAGWPGKPKRLICRPNSSTAGSSRWRAADAMAPRNAGGTSTPPARPPRCTAAKPSPASCANTPSTAASCPLTTLLGTGVPRARLRSRTSLASGSKTTATAGTPWRSASARQPARRLGSRPVVSITVVSLRAKPLGDDELEQLERVLRRALVALAGADDGAQAVRRDDLLGREPLRRPVRLAGAAGADEHDEAGIGQAQRGGHRRLTRTAAAPSRRARRRTAARWRCRRTPRRHARPRRPVRRRPSGSRPRR